MSKPVITFVFKKCYATDCFGTYFIHVQTRDTVRVQSATQRTASVHTLHMSKPVTTFVFKVLRNGLLRYILYTCPKPVITFVFKVLRNGHMSKPVITFVFKKCYATDCFGTYFTHVQTRDNVRVQKVLRNGLLRYILYTCPNP